MFGEVCMGCTVISAVGSKQEGCRFDSFPCEAPVSKTNKLSGSHSVIINKQPNSDRLHFTLPLVSADTGDMWELVPLAPQPCWFADTSANGSAACLTGSRACDWCVLVFIYWTAAETSKAPELITKPQALFHTRGLEGCDSLQANGEPTQTCCTNTTDFVT